MRTDQIKYGTYCNLLPSAALCKSLCELFQQSYPKIFGVFKEQILPYKRVDFNANALPALTIYPTIGRTVSESWYMNSSINMDFIYPGGSMIRDRSTEIANVISEAVIFTILKNDNIFELLKFGLPDSHGNPTWGKFPGLVEIGEKIDAEFGDVNSLVKEADSVRMTLKCSYKIDTVQWWQYIQEILGNNIFDPCAQIYPLIEDYSLAVTLHSVTENIPT
jgi:hypothetical protein